MINKEKSIPCVQWKITNWLYCYFLPYMSGSDYVIIYFRAEYLFTYIYPTQSTYKADNKIYVCKIEKFIQARSYSEVLIKMRWLDLHTELYFMIMFLVYRCFATLQFATYTYSLPIRVRYQRFRHLYTFATRHFRYPAPF